MNSQRSITVLGPVAAALLFLFAACGPGSQVEIDSVRRAPPEAAFVKADASSAERFGGVQNSHQGHDHPAQNPFIWETPAGWVELPPQQFREINLRPGGVPELECYLTVLQGDGGGLAANVNRWRSQLGLDPMSEGATDFQPNAILFGRPAVRVELTSEGDDARALFGLILQASSSMVTVKMTGPAAAVEEHRAGFDLFCETLAVRGPEAADQGPPEDHSSTAGAMPELVYEVPEGWTDAGASSMRLVNLEAPGSSQCYVIRLPGEAGGMLNNLNRWRAEVGLEPLEPSELEQLPKVDLLGEQCSLLEVSGEYRGMGDLSGPGMTLLGVALIGSESSLFVKMVGPEAEVAAQKQRFISFLRSLNEA